MNVARAGRLRAVLLSLSAAACVAHVCGLDDPLEAAEAPATPMPVVETTRAHDRFDASFVRRDPFEGAPAVPHIATPSGSDVRWNANHETTTIDVPAIAPLADAAIPHAATDVVGTFVRATIVGPHPVAYVNDGGALQIVRLGDLVSNRIVVAIDMRGLEFRDGTRLDLPDENVPTPAALATAQRSDDGIRAELEHMRALLKPRATAPRATAPRDSAARAMPPPLPRIDPAPTPQALRTVDPGGVPVGARPTPDMVDPTAYPVPYHYGIPTF